MPNLSTGNYKNHGIKRNVYEYKELLPKLREAYPFLKEVLSQSLQQAVFDLNNAYQKFFEKKAGYLKFKKKRSGGSIFIPQGFC